VRLRERRQASSLIRRLGATIQERNEEIAQLKRGNAGLVEEANRRVRSKDEEITKVKQEYDELAHEWARDKAERVNLAHVVVEMSKRIYNWPRKEGG
jgi:uncharacterized coiled-coil DUF342 family protein